MFSNISGLEIFYNKSIYSDDSVYDKIIIIFDIGKRYRYQCMNNEEKDYFENSIIESFKPYLIDLEIEDLYLINKISVNITFLGNYKKIKLNDILKKLKNKSKTLKYKNNTEPPKKIMKF